MPQSRPSPERAPTAWSARMRLAQSPGPLRRLHRSCSLAIPFLPAGPMTASRIPAPCHAERDQSAEGQGHGQRREVSTYDEDRRRLDDDDDLTAVAVHVGAQRRVGAVIEAVVDPVVVLVERIARTAEVVVTEVEGTFVVAIIKPVPVRVDLEARAAVRVDRLVGRRIGAEIKFVRNVVEIVVVPEIER